MPCDPDPIALGTTQDIVHAGRNTPRWRINPRLFPLLVLGASLLAGCAQPPAKPLTLATGGTAALPIIIATNAPAATREVAADLARFLGRISGATFEVKPGDGSAGIVLGSAREFPHPEFAKVLEIRNTYDGREAYVIRTEPNRLLLIGATDRGVPHAAYRLLEELGCRRFFPHPAWEIVPATPALSVRLDIADRPALLARRVWAGIGSGVDTVYPPGTQDIFKSWARFNRMASSFTPYCGHAWQSIILDNRRAFEEHPEYLALVGGQRQTDRLRAGDPGQFCVSNPEVRRLAVEWALKYLRQTPDADMVSMEPSDGTGHCECDACRKLGSVSDRVFGLANEVARAVAKEFPGKMVGLYAYSDHSEPPSFDLEPNVHVQLTGGFNSGRYSFDDLIELWPKRCRNLGFYEYYSVWVWDYDRPPAGLGANLGLIRERLQKFLKHGATSVDAESSQNWGLYGWGTYVANRLMWDPNADADRLLDDFCEKAFGPAVQPMKRYFERFDPGRNPLVSEHLLALAFRDVDEASRLAKDRPDVMARLDHLKLYLRYVQLRWTFDREADPAKKKALVVPLMMHIYRTKPYFLVYARAYLTGYTTSMPKEYNEPTWSFQDPTPKPWAIDQPFTHDEIEQQFREGLGQFQPQQLLDRSFSKDLVPVRFETDAHATTSQLYQHGLRYAFVILGDEPLTLDIMTGTITKSPGKPDARYTVASPGGAQIVEGRLPQDGAVHRLELKTPRPGLYYFDYESFGAGWHIAVPQERPFQLVLTAQPLYHGGHMQRLYFYVPKGTKQFQYFVESVPHEIVGPDGTVVKKVEDTATYVTVPVPAGMDGKPWSFTHLCLGRLVFQNIPNCLAASPNALILPRDLVAADGLSSPDSTGQRP